MSHVSKFQTASFWILQPIFVCMTCKTVYLAMLVILLSTATHIIPTSARLLGVPQVCDIFWRSKHLNRRQTGLDHSDLFSVRGDVKIELQRTWDGLETPTTQFKWFCDKLKTQDAHNNWDYFKRKAVTLLFWTFSKVVANVCLSTREKIENPIKVARNSGEIQATLMDVNIQLVRYNLLGWGENISTVLH